MKRGRMVTLYRVAPDARSASDLRERSSACEPSSAEALDVRDTDPVLHVKLLEVLHLPEDHPRPISERGSHAGPLSRLRRRVTADTPPRWRKPFRMSARGAIKGLTQTRNADYNSHDRRSIHIRYCFRLERGGNPSLVQNSVLSSRKYLQGSKPSWCERGITGGWMADSACSAGGRNLMGFSSSIGTHPESTPKRSTRGATPPFSGTRTRWNYRPLTNTQQS